MKDIHSTAQISADAILGEGTRVGPFAIVEGGVVTGPRCEIHGHAMVRSGTTLGEEVKVHPGAVVGGDPQHLKYKGESTTLIVGDRTTLREATTVHRGTTIGTGQTVVGKDCFLMAYSHVAHDCIIGDGVILANNVQIGGHSEVGNYATIGGSCAIAQFVRVGTYAFVGGFFPMRKDFPPYLAGKGTPENRPMGVNAIGLERHGFSESTVKRLEKLYRIFYMRKGLTVAQAIETTLEEVGDHDEVRFFLDFVRSSKFGILRGNNS